MCVRACVEGLVAVDQARLLLVIIGLSRITALGRGQIPIHAALWGADRRAAGSSGACEKCVGAPVEAAITLNVSGMQMRILVRG